MAVVTRIISHSKIASTLLVMPQLDIGTRFQIFLGESQALRNLDVHFLPIALQIGRLLLLPVCVFMYIFCIVIMLLSNVVCVISKNTSPWQH